MLRPHELPRGHSYWTLSEEAARGAAMNTKGVAAKDYWAGDSVGLAWCVRHDGVQGAAVINWFTRTISDFDPVIRETKWQLEKRLDP